jgi:cold shock CspA family protein
MHAPEMHARVTVLVPESDFGRMETPDGRDIYFHRNSLVNADFDDLAVGTELRFVEGAGEEGPQASSVFVVRRG